MIEQKFTDSERQLLVVLVQKALIEIKGDLDMWRQIDEVRTLLGKLSGTDTVLVAQRAYSSHRDEPGDAA
jgi:hypothetical protein